MTTTSRAEELYATVATLLIAREDREAIKLLETVSSSDLNEFRELASRVRTLAADVARSPKNQT